MIENYIPVILILAFAVIFAVVAIKASRFFGPWAVSFVNFQKPEMVYALWVALIFIVILILGLVYEYKKGVLKWD